MSGSAQDLSYVIIPTFVSIVALTTAGAWTIMRAVRSRASKTLFWLLVAFSAFYPVNRALYSLLVALYPPTTDAFYHLEYWLSMGSLYLACMLPVAASAAFFVVARQLRGAA